MCSKSIRFIISSYRGRKGRLANASVKPYVFENTSGDHLKAEPQRHFSNGILPRQLPH